MRGILERLYNGEIVPVEMEFPKNAEYRNLSFEIGGMREGIRKGMSEEGLKEFEELETQIARLTKMENECSFSYGFKIGILIATEIYANK